MFKTFTATFFTLIFTFGCYTKIAKGSDDKTSAKDQGVLVIPFQPTMYFCNDDQFICKASNITPGELNKTLRASIASNMILNLSDKYTTNAISEKPQENKKSDVEELYSIARYSLEEKPLVAYYKKNKEKSSKNLFGLKPEKDGPEYLNPDKPNLKKHRYYRAQFADTAKLGQILRPYGIHYVLFIDHFEMETHYKDCIERQKNVSQRDLYVHFTLLDDKGKFKDGGVVCMTYLSSSNVIKDIMKETLPSLSSMILEEVKQVIK